MGTFAPRACLPNLGVVEVEGQLMTRTEVLADVDWVQLEPLLPSSAGVRGRPFRDHRQVLEGIFFRYRTGCAWRDLPPP